MFDNYMNVKETAKYLGIGIKKTYNLCKTPTFPVRKIGNKLFVNKDAIDNIWLPNREQTTLSK